MENTFINSIRLVQVQLLSPQIKFAGFHRILAGKKEKRDIGAAAVSKSQSCRCLDVTLTSTQISLRLKNSSDDTKQIKQTVVRLNFQQLGEQPEYIGCHICTREKMVDVFQSLYMVDHGIIYSIKVMRHQLTRGMLKPYMKSNNV